MARPTLSKYITASNEKSFNILSRTFLNAGEIDLTPYGVKERETGDLYGLFCTASPEAPGAETARRIYYHKEP